MTLIVHYLVQHLGILPLVASFLWYYPAPLGHDGPTGATGGSPGHPPGRGHASEKSRGRSPMELRVQDARMGTDDGAAKLCTNSHPWELRSYRSFTAGHHPAWSNERTGPH